MNEWNEMNDSASAKALFLIVLVVYQKSQSVLLPINIYNTHYNIYCF